MCYQQDEINWEDIVTKIDFQELSLSGISHRCARESDRFFNRQDHDPRFCFELFRRAILLRNELAWDRIYTQYERLVQHWVERHAAFPTSGEEAQFFMNRAFEKMWLGLTPEKFEDFDDLKSILRYLQMCVHSVMVDFVRQKEYKKNFDYLQDQFPQLESQGSNAEKEVTQRIMGQTLLEFLNRQVQDEREACIVNYMLVLDLKSREVAEKFRDTFSDVNEVYRVKENLLARLRRNTELKQLLNDA